MALKEILDFVFPQYCISCGRILRSNEAILCHRCAKLVKEIRQPCCKKCARSLAFKGMLCPECKNRKTYLSALWSYAHYIGIMKKLIHTFKYRKRKYVIKFLDERISDFTSLIKKEANIDLIVPVPLCKAHLKKRDFNQSFIVAKMLSSKMGVPAISCMERIKITVPQHELPRIERFDNVADAFIVSYGEIKGKNILLVDDIFTTGATINECARVLLDAGANKIYGFTLARGI